MIALIFALCFLFIFLLTLWIMFNRESINETLDRIVFKTSLTITVLCFFNMLVGISEEVDNERFMELSIIANNYYELSEYEKMIINKNIRKWNDNLNYFNNYWFKFSIEDRNKYIIEIKEEETCY